MVTMMYWRVWQAPVWLAPDDFISKVSHSAGFFFLFFSLRESLSKCLVLHVKKEKEKRERKREKKNLSASQTERVAFRTKTGLGKFKFFTKKTSADQEQT